LIRSKARLDDFWSNHALILGHWIAGVGKQSLRVVGKWVPEDAVPSEKIGSYGQRLLSVTNENLFRPIGHKHRITATFGTGLLV
jgi:hypothetical protein